MKQKHNYKNYQMVRYVNESYKLEIFNPETNNINTEIVSNRLDAIKRAKEEVEKGNEVEIWELTYKYS